MTITRLGQFTAELNTVQDLALLGSNPPTISNTQKRTGSYAYRFGGTLSPFGLAFSARAQVRAGVWVWHNGGSNQAPLLTLPVGNVYVRLLMDHSNNTLLLSAGYVQNTLTIRYPVAAVSAGPLANRNQWVHVGVHYKCDAAGGFFTVYIDGVAQLSWAGDTRVYNGGSNTPEPASILGCYAAGVLGSGNWSNYLYVDDFYIDDTAGSADAAVPGRRFLVAVANGAGFHAQMTPVGAASNYAAVDDPLSAQNDGDTTYVKALAPNLMDTYQMTSVTLPTDYSIRAVIPVVVARKLDSTDVQVALVASDGTNTAIGAAQNISTSYNLVWERMTTQPNGAAWSETAFNNTKFGQKSAGSYT
jgi:hypothetical protein